MARKVIWAPRAIFLLEEAADHIAVDSPQAAERFVNDVLTAAATLADLSDRGRTVPELADTIHRELLIGDYRLIYRAEQNRVAIVAFIHGSRDFRSWWNRYRRDRAPN